MSETYFIVVGVNISVNISHLHCCVTKLYFHCFQKCEMWTVIGQHICL